MSTKTEKQKMIDGDIYDPSDQQLVHDRLQARKVVREFNQTSEINSDKRREIIKQLFGSTGKELHVESNFHCDYGYNLHVDENFYANFDCVILDCGVVKMGDNCLLAPGVHIYTAAHPIDPIDRASGIEFTKSVSIGHNVWIGGRSVINPGVTLGDNVVVASGSVVTSDVPDNVVVAGVPAKPIKTINKYRHE